MEHRNLRASYSPWSRRRAKGLDLAKMVVQGRPALHVCELSLDLLFRLTFPPPFSQVGLKGEDMNLESRKPISSVDWVQGSLVAGKQQPLTWYKAYFNSPKGDDPLALDMSSMGKGQVWINGHSIGRYWTLYAEGNCTGCSYSATFRPARCQLGCGQPTQKWYHVPRSWLKSTRNLLVLFEEIGGDASKISLVKRLATSN
ncbi:BETA-GALACTOSIDASE RELATED [Salix purpurea]|uniref:BETA-GALACTOSIDASE RELATED n=1 Tax=Salix purpurea TaxID=77065 RepID=A0A9Q0WEZ6_SALPP|nr:BETA-GALACTOSIDASE RELATED [Salix purpurea]